VALLIHTLRVNNGSIHPRLKTWYSAGLRRSWESIQLAQRARGGGSTSFAWGGGDASPGNRKKADLDSPAIFIYLFTARYSNNLLIHLSVKAGRIFYEPRLRAFLGATRHRAWYPTIICRITSAHDPHTMWVARSGTEISRVNGLFWLRP